MFCVRRVCCVCFVYVEFVSSFDYPFFSHLKTIKWHLVTLVPFFSPQCVFAAFVQQSVSYICERRK